ncbi:MAG: methionine adenosyltransferase [Gemmatimonadota bacterium]|jgi:S-adenosylmethionine synthetase|nr:methionine adenosyltransferase [Gemmatimonadota bacterium]
MSVVEMDLQEMVTSAYTFTSESVSEGHPDKVCDYIADSILDAHLEVDPTSRVACEVLAKEDNVVLAGEITSSALIDYDSVVRRAIAEIGYVTPDQVFRADNVRITSFLTRQSPEISQGVTAATSLSGDQGAGDQGIMFGYATDETPELMPLPVLLAHRLSATVAEFRRRGIVDWLRPDAKTQVSVAYEDNRPVRVTDVLVSTQHTDSVGRSEIEAFLKSDVIPGSLGGWYSDQPRVLVNPTGSFVQGGPSADAGVTGRKIIVDTYGGMGRHGGGAFSGKDPSKVDRSGAYFCRFVARQVVLNGFARKAEVQVAYAIGMAHPISVKVDTFGTGNERLAVEFVRENFDFRPRAIIERLDLLRPIYRRTTNYGHFGKPGLPWEV